MKFRARLLGTGGNTTGFEVPEAVVEGLGGGRRPAVTVVFNGFSYRTSIAWMGGRFMLPVSAERRAAAKVGAGDEFDVEVELDASQRDPVLPADFAEALAGDTVAQGAFDKLAYSRKQRHILPIEDAKTPETRQRRILKAIEALRAGQ